LNIRLQLIELEDQHWFPHVIRQGMLDFLRFMISKLNAYEAAIPLLKELLQKVNQDRIIDLCSGAGGGIAVIQEAISRELDRPVEVILTDLYPNITSYQYLKGESSGVIDYVAEPVNAMAVPEHLQGVRTIFSSFHHFTPAQAVTLLQDAADKREAIGIFEGAGKSWLELLALWTVFPFLILILTPFIRPFKISRLFFTYFIPVIPMGILWDGTVSLLRIYTPEMLKKMANSVQTERYNWKAGKTGTRFGKKVIFLIGYPLES
jgi:ActR/RegA family two-component response regulator